MITGIAHACFVVSDLDRSVEFYRDALGMEPAFDFTDENGRRTGLYLHAGARTFIELFEGEAGQPEGPVSFRHICLEVDDLEAAVESLRGKGLEVTDPHLGRDNSLQAWITDPDGNRLEFHCYTPDSWQMVSLS